DDVDLVFARSRSVTDRFIDLADVVNTTVGSAIDFEDVQGSSRIDIQTGRAGVTRLKIFRKLAAIERFGKYPCERRFPCPSATAKQVGMSKTVLPKGIFQCCDNCFLADNAGKCLRAVFARDDLIMLRLGIHGFLTG